MAEQSQGNTGVGFECRSHAFPDTHWTLLLTKEIGDKESTVIVDRRFDSLCTSYWYPLYAYLRKRGHSSHDAQDHTQGFFTHLLTRNRIANLDPDQGRFRSYLLGALNHYLSDRRKHAQAAKRGGGQMPLSIDEHTAEGRFQSQLADDLTPEKLFDREWATTILNESKAQLAQDFAAQGKAAIFAEVGEFLTLPPSKGEYLEIAHRLRMTKENVRAIVSRMRKRYKSILRQQILATVSAEEEIDEEIRYLFSAIG